MSRPALLPGPVLDLWLASYPAWRVVEHRLSCEFAVSYAEGVDILNLVNPSIEELDHHPRVILEYGGLNVELWTHDRDGITQLDVDLAAKFSQAAAATLAARGG